MTGLVTFMFCAVLMAWHSFGDLPGTVGIAIGVWGSAFIGLWRIKRQERLPFNENTPAPANCRPAVPPKAPPPPPPTRAVRGDIRPGPPPPPPPPPTVEYVGRRIPPSVYCQHCLAELELAERFSRESG